MARPGTERLLTLRTAKRAVRLSIRSVRRDVDGDELGPLGPGDRWSKRWRDTAVEFGDRELATGIRRGLND